MHVFGRWEESGIPGGNTRNTRRTPPTEQVLFYRQKTKEAVRKHTEKQVEWWDILSTGRSRREGTTDPWRVEDPSDWKDWQLGSLRSSRWETKQEKSVKMMYLKTTFDREAERANQLSEQVNVLPVIQSQWDPLSGMSSAVLQLYWSSWSVQQYYTAIYWRETWVAERCMKIIKQADSSVFIQTLQLQQTSWCLCSQIRTDHVPTVVKRQTPRLNQSMNMPLFQTLQQENFHVIVQNSGGDEFLHGQKTWYWWYTEWLGLSISYNSTTS